MTKGGNVHFVRSTQVEARDVLSVGGSQVWSSCETTFRRIDELCGDGSSRLFAEPNVKKQAEGDRLIVAWFGSYDDEAKHVDALDRAMRARIQADLAARIEALRPALYDPEIGETVAAMLNLFDDQAIMAVGENVILTNWGVLALKYSRVSGRICPALRVRRSARTSAREYHREFPANHGGLSERPRVTKVRSSNRRSLRRRQRQRQYRRSYMPDLGPASGLRLRSAALIIRHSYIRRMARSSRLREGGIH